MKAGNGGNGGAGGSSGRGKDQVFNVATGSNYLRNYKAGDAGDGGAGGEAGSVMINDSNSFAQENYIKSYNGIAGIEGAKGRDAVGGIIIRNNTEKSIYVRTVFAEDSTSGVSPITYSKDNFNSLLDNNSEKENLVKKILDLANEGYDDSETKYPTEEDGARWDGSNYAALLEEANPTEGQN